MNDERSLAYLRRTGPGQVELRLRSLASGEDKLLRQENNDLMSLSPDGQIEVFVRNRDLLAQTAGDPVPRTVTKSVRGRPAHWSADLRHLLIGSFSATGTPEPRMAREIDMKSDRISVLTQHPTVPLHAGRISPDGHWFSFFTANSPTTRQMFVAPFSPGTEIPQEKWVAISGGKGLDREPRWSSQGNLMYFLSERDGFRCIWAQRLDRVTRKPLGDSFPFFHAHSARLSLDVGTDTSLNGLEVIGPKFYVSMAETTGNLWMATW